MRYDEFFAQFKQAHHDWSMGLIDTAAATVEIARLRLLVPQLSDTDRKTAEFNLAGFEAEISPEAQDRMARAAAAVSVASADGGTVDERIARAEAGMTEVTRIANETDDESEQHQILEMNEMLASLVEALRPDRTAGS